MCFVKVMIGKKFGRWLVVGPVIVRLVGKAPTKYVCCVCECGTKRYVWASQVKQGKSTSCGCLSSEFLIKLSTKHDMSRSPTYKSWVGMMDRCYRKKAPNYPLYGGRGLRVCKRWHRFDLFFEDMKTRPHGTSIDRVNNSKGYSKKNCRWATSRQQALNRRTTKMVRYKNKLTPIAELAALSGLSYQTVHRRMESGLPIEAAISFPPLRPNKSNLHRRRS